MSKTYKALQKAEAEKSTRSATPPVARPRGRWKAPSHPLEECRGMKYRILCSNPDQAVKTLLFCSSTEGEGTSTVLINFALTLASEGDKVVLIDANLRHPSLHDAFNLDKENGLIDLLLEKSTVNEVIKNTPFNNLSVITIGSPPPNLSPDRGPWTVDSSPDNPSLILKSNPLDSHIEEMKAQADWIFFDSGPIHSSNASVVLAGKVDGVVLVVEAEKTRWEVAQNAQQRIESANGKILGAILNKRRFYIPAWLYKSL
jgi:protein-tyrosine kinase